MNKKKPTYLLHDVQILAKSGLCKLTITAQKTADALGFSQSEVLDVIATLESGDFYKSVNEYGNHKVWQERYGKMCIGQLPGASNCPPRSKYLSEVDSFLSSCRSKNNNAACLYETLFG